MNPAGFISVVICTHNRAALLRQTLASLVTQRLSQDEWEVIVVDNASTDATPAVANAFSGQLPIRRVVEPTLGLCHARNTGWREARGEYIAYLDDDTIAGENWLMTVRDVFARVPDAGMVGGPVAAIWTAPRPAWLSDNAARALAIVDWGTAAHRIANVDVEWLVGANMAVVRAVLQAVGGFHPGIDRVGHNMLSSGDVHLQRRIIEHGYKVQYEPAMSIGHVIPASRLTKQWFRRRYFWQGISDSVMRIIEERPSAVRRLGWTVGSALRLAQQPRTVRAALASPDDAAAFTSTCHALIAVGQVAGLLRMVGR